MKHKNIVILGGGESGIGAAILALKMGYSVFLSEANKIHDEYKIILLEKGIVFEEGKHSEEKILTADWVIKSPGIPNSAQIIQKIKEKKIEISSEIEFASRNTQVPIIAITGSNGKTTTTSLLYHIVSKSQFKGALVGNIGKSFAWHIATEEKPDFYIAEISSFQLDDIQQFKPHIAILLNITPDHLDRYNYDIIDYAKAKFRITENQDSNDYFIYLKEDKIIQDLLEKHPTKAQKISFSIEEENPEGAGVLLQQMSINIQEPLKMNFADLSLLGKHNLANSMAAATAAKLMQLKNKTIQMGLSDFESVEHRLENVFTIQGIKFINDSKATNVNAVYYALECISTPVVWIAGGVDKGNDYSEIQHLVENKVKALVCLGKDNSKIINAFKDIVPKWVETQNMGDAVRSAFVYAKKGDTVLLSPATASFDLFKNYEDRGNQFKEEVRKL